MAYRIIIAEDEVDVRDFMVRALDRILPQATVTAVSNGVEALEVFQKDGADLILSDHRMPVMSGLDLLRAIRSLSALPFVLISADSMIEERAINAGVSDFLAKPLSLAQLRAVICRYLP